MKRILKFDEMFLGGTKPYQKEDDKDKYVLTIVVKTDRGGRESLHFAPDTEENCKKEKEILKKEKKLDGKEIISFYISPASSGVGTSEFKGKLPIERED